MNLHDWSLTDAGAFHQFHSGWILGLCRVLNNGGLPPGYGAHSERITGPGEPDVLVADAYAASDTPGGGPAVLEASRVAATVRVDDGSEPYVRRQRRLVIRRRDRRVVSVTEFVSMANKDSRRRFEDFLRKSVAVIDEGAHLTVVDVQRPLTNDPRGMVDAVWEHLTGGLSGLDSLAAGAVRNDAGLSLYAEPLTVGRPVADVPLFLDGEAAVTLPLAEAYADAWATMPPDERAEVSGA